VGLGGGLDVPGDQLGTEGFGQLLGEHGLAGARLTLDQQRALQGDGSVDGQFQVIGGNVGLGAFELHRSFLEFINARTIPRGPGDCERRRVIQSLNGGSHIH
jgi:hypothetical protein